MEVEWPTCVAPSAETQPQKQELSSETPSEKILFVSGARTSSWINVISGATTMSSMSKPTVLAVEDNPETRLLLKYQLEKTYDLTMVSGVDPALEAIEDRSFDLLLLDIYLGEGRTGTDLLHLIRKREKTYTPAIALTAYALPEDEERFLSQGFDQYVGKPFTRHELEKALEQTLATC